MATKTDYKTFIDTNGDVYREKIVKFIPKRKIILSLDLTMNNDTIELILI